MTDDSVALRCPVCAEPLLPVDQPARALSCPRGHRYDAAKQGYFNLLTGRGTPFREDTAAMVAARARFQAAGHYGPLAGALCEEVASRLPAGRPPRIIDAGAGTGYYLDAVTAALEQAGEPPAVSVALDISRYAMRRAARVPGTRALVWDLWRPLPVADGAADALLNVFAPRNGAEFARVLSPGGFAFVVTPLPEHLGEAIGPLGMLSIASGKDDSVATALGEAFDAVETREVRSDLRLSDDDAVDLALMGPAGHHHGADAIRERLAACPLPPLVTAAFRLQVFRRH